MRRIVVFSLIALALAGWVSAQEVVDSERLKPNLDADAERPDEATGSFVVGYHGVDLDGSANNAAEFNTLDDSPHAKLDILGPIGDSGVYIVDAMAWDTNQQDYFVRIEPNRAVQIELDYTRFPHNLPHDPMTNLESVFGIKVVEHTDYSPDEMYSIRYENGHAAVNGKAPGLPGLHYTVKYRYQGRKGTRQSMTTGHCFSCHTFSKTKMVNEKTRDLVGIVGYEGKNWNLRYEFLGRNFEEKGEQTTVEYDKVYRPNNPNLLVFEDRAQYDSQDGTLPYGVVPESRKLSHTLKGSWTGQKGGTLSGAIVYSDVKNNDTSLKSEYTTGRLRYHNTLKDGLIGLKLGYRQDNLENDDIYVQPNQRVSIMGPPPYIGNTYQDMWGPGGVWGRGDDGFVADFLRESAMNRTVRTGEAGLRFRLPARNTLRLDWTYKSIDRDHYAVNNDGDTDTVSNKIRLMALGRPARKFRYRVEVAYTDTDNPFVNVDGACQADAEEVLGTRGVSPSPLLGDSLQYYELHRLRTADVAPQSTEEWKTNGYFTWAPGAKGSVTVLGRYKDRKNTKTGTSDWSAEGWTLGAQAFFAPNPQFYGTVSLQHMEDEYTTPVCVPLMEA